LGRALAAPSPPAASFASLIPRGGSPGHPRLAHNPLTRATRGRPLPVSLARSAARKRHPQHDAREKYPRISRTGHEIVRLYEARLADPSFYEREVIKGAEEDGEPLHCMWKPIADFERGVPLYPDGLLDVLRGGTG